MDKWNRGDHIRADRVLYWHHGIYAGEGRVIHFSGTGSEKADVEIRYDSYEAFPKGDSVERVDYASCNPPD